MITHENMTETQEIAEKFVQSAIDSHKEASEFYLGIEKHMLNRTEEQIKGIQDLVEFTTKSHLNLLDLTFKNWKTNNDLLMNGMKSLTGTVLNDPKPTKTSSAKN
ncbi:hypothetical protein HOF92_03335 [bacterium]|jgi:hypothetical protein|nr:hypothetical protein [bacterium]